MRRLVEFVSQVSNGERAVFVGWPLSYDWMWMYWYLMNYVGFSPFGFSSAIDLKTMLMTKRGISLREVSKRSLPREVRSTRPHTHRADDDAKEQGEIARKLMRWTPSPF